VGDSDRIVTPTSNTYFKVLGDEDPIPNPRLEFHAKNNLDEDTTYLTIRNPTS
jgi:hypothetical protein